MAHETQIVDLARPGGRAGSGRHLAAAVAVVHRVPIVDHGTGLGEEVSRLVGVDAREVDRIVHGRASVDGDPLAVEIRPAHAPQTVWVSTAAQPSEVVARGDVATHIVHRLTRHLLDHGSAPASLHAGAAVDHTGQAVMVIGPSGAGKSTLVAELAAHPRWRLVNDEQVTVLSSEGLIGGFTRPISLKRPTPPTLPHAVDDPVAFGDANLVPARSIGTTHAVAGRPSLIVLPEVAADADETTVEIVTPGSGLIDLCANSLDLAARPAIVLAELAWLAATRPIIRLRYRSAADAASVVRQRLADAVRAPALPRAVSDAATPVAHASTRAGSPQVARRTFAVSIGDEVVLLNTASRQLALLNPAGARAWRTQAWTDPGPDDHTRAAFIADLLAHGYLTAGGGCLGCG